MTSRIPEYAIQPAFVTAIAAAPAARFSAARLVSNVTGLPLGPQIQRPDTNDILAQIIIEEVLTTPTPTAHPPDHHPAGPATCATRRTPAPQPTPPDADRGLPVVRRTVTARPARPPLALTWAQGAGGIVSSLQDMTRDRDLYLGRELPPLSSASSKASSPRPPGNRSSPPRPPIRRATDSASSRSPTSPSGRYGPTKAAPSATGSSTSYFPIPASSSPSPSTARPSSQRPTRHARGHGLPDPPESRRGARGLNIPASSDSGPGYPALAGVRGTVRPADHRPGSQPEPDLG